MLAFVALFVLPLTLAIPIENGLEGEPEVQCGPTSIQFSVTTQNSFNGVVYAKNHFADSNCARVGEGNNGGGIEMNFEDCNVRRVRSLEPRGIFVTATVVVQFHANVLTKVDRAFHLRCFYMEADKTVDQELEVSMITTELRTFLVPMPVCRYQILDQATQLDIRFVIIGDKVTHKWTCDTETQETFCMEVYSCYVDDNGNFGGEASRIDLVDQDGCSLDGNLLPNIEYVSDLMGVADSHVFKYADRPQLYFNCQIRIGVKEPNGDCQDFREQPCQEPGLTSGRRKRSAEKEAPGQLGLMDVTPGYPVFVADVELTQDDIPESLRSVLNHSQQKQLEARLATKVQAAAPEQCVSIGYLSGGVALLGVFVIAIAAMSVKLCSSRK